MVNRKKYWKVMVWKYYLFKIERKTFSENMWKEIGKFYCYIFQRNYPTIILNKVLYSELGDIAYGFMCVKSFFLCDFNSISVHIWILEWIEWKIHLFHIQKNAYDCIIPLSRKELFRSRSNKYYACF